METNIDIIYIKNNIKNIEFLCLKKNDTFSSGFEPLKALIHKDIFDKIKNMYINPLELILNKSEFEEFSYEVNTTDTIPVLPVKEISKSSLLDVLLHTINSMSSIDAIDKFTKTLSESYLYAFIFTLNNGKKLTIIRKVYSLNYLKNKGLLSYTDSRLNFVSEDLFALDSKIDCIIYDDYIYIISKHNFETIFSYNSHYLDKANLSLNSISTSDILHNFNEFKIDCLGRSTITRKLAELNVHGDINSFIKKLKTQPKTIEDTIKKYNLDINIKDNKIIYEDVSSLSEIINLISENYFEGSITPNNKYIARVKRKLPSTRKIKKVRK